MITMYARLVALLAGVVGAVWLGIASVAGAAQTETIYIASANDGSVFAYDASSLGFVSPVGELDNPALPGTFWSPWGVAVDAAGYVYVQTFLSNATSFVFPPGAQAGTPPSRVFRGGGPDSRAIAVDANGYEYVATGQSSAQIMVLPPGAAGQPENLYSVTPLRSIPTDESLWYPWPGILSTDAAGNVLAAITRFQGNAIEVFPGGPTGDGTPARVIAGSHTGLGTTPDRVVVSYSPYTGRLYVGVSAGASTHISSFAVDATDDAGPISTISGPSTDLAGRMITGIATSQVDGSIYVMVKEAQFGGAGFVGVFDPFADGDAAPMREFTDVDSVLVDAQGIALARADSNAARLPLRRRADATSGSVMRRDQAYTALPERLRRAPSRPSIPSPRR